jgi:hypothetical protein
MLSATREPIAVAYRSNRKGGSDLPVQGQWCKLGETRLSLAPGKLRIDTTWGD